MSNISFEKLPITTHRNIPVITTEMLANLYGTDPKLVRQNYQRNAERFIDGKHCFKLQGEELRAFKDETSQRGLVNIYPKVSHLFLWTERGAARHAKMLETEQAWEVFERLEDCYFDRKPIPPEQLPVVATTMSVRDARRGKKDTDNKVAARIAEKCVPVIMREMRDYQYHYSNSEVGPAEVLPALLSDDRQGLQLQALLRELGENNHEVSGAFRELEVIRYCLLEQRKIIRDIGTHAQYIMAQVAGR